MTLLQIKNRIAPEDTQHVGVKIPLRVSSYLSLYALAHEHTKALILRNMIEEWYAEVKPDNTEDELIERIVGYIYRQWLARKTHTPDEPYPTYLQMVKDEMLKKGLDLTDIDIIITKLHEKNKGRASKQASKEESNNQEGSGKPKLRRRR